MRSIFVEVYRARGRAYFGVSSFCNKRSFARRGITVVVDDDEGITRGGGGRQRASVELNRLDTTLSVASKRLVTF